MSKNKDKKGSDWRVLVVLANSYRYQQGFNTLKKKKKLLNKM